MKRLILTVFAVLLWAAPASAQQEVDALALYLGVTGSVCKGTSGSAPASPATCDFYINTTTGVWYARWSTGAWVQMGYVPAALTKTDDTNVTLTLGGSPSTALLQGVSLTLGWTGQLSDSRGGTGLSAACASAGQFLRSTGAAWGCSTPTLPNAAASASYLRGDGTNWIESTLKLPNSSTAYRVLFSSATNTVSDATAGGMVQSDAGFSAKAYGVSRYGAHLYADAYGSARLDATDATDKVWIPLELRASVVNVRGNATVYGDATIAGNLLPDAANTRSIGSITKPWLTIDVSEFRARTIVAQDVMSTIGGVLNILPTSALTADVGTGDLSITVKHNLFAVGDVVWMQKFGQFEAMRIAGSATGSAGLYIYLVDRNLDGTGANAWVDGDGVQNTGTTGDGMIELYATAGVTSGTVGPTIVGNVRTGTAYNAMSPRWAIGNCNGLYGYSGDVQCVALGDNDNAWVKVDPTNGVRMGHGSDVRVSINPTTGIASFVGSVTVTGGNAATTIYVDTAEADAVSTASGDATTKANAAAAASLDKVSYLTPATTTIAGGTITTNTIHVDAINASTLSSITADLGTVTAGSISVVNGANTVGLTPSGTNAIFAGPTGAPTFTVTPAGVVTATSGTVGGCTLASTSVTCGSFVMDSNGASTAVETSRAYDGSKGYKFNGLSYGGTVGLWAAEDASSRFLTLYNVVTGSNDGRISLIADNSSVSKTAAINLTSGTPSLSASIGSQSDWFHSGNLNVGDGSSVGAGVGQVTIVDLASSTGTNYVCSSTTGLLTNSASACSGTDADLIAQIPYLLAEIGRLSQLLSSRGAK